jgi:hypothetical protein
MCLVEVDKGSSSLAKAAEHNAEQVLLLLLLPLLLLPLSLLLLLPGFAW